MAQTLLRKRPHREVRPTVELPEPFAEMQSRQRLNKEGQAAMRFKSTQKAVERVQSIFDNIVDLLSNLEQIDKANAKGLSS